jgi:hypothetical protein
MEELDCSMKEMESRMEGGGVQHQHVSLVEAATPENQQQQVEEYGITHLQLLMTTSKHALQNQKEHVASNKPEDSKDKLEGMEGRIGGLMAELKEAQELQVVSKIMVD